MMLKLPKTETLYIYYSINSEKYEDKKYQLHLSSSAQDTQNKIYQEKRRGSFIPCISVEIQLITG